MDYSNRVFQFIPVKSSTQRIDSFLPKHAYIINKAKEYKFIFFIEGVNNLFVVLFLFLFVWFFIK